MKIFLTLLTSIAIASPVLASETISLETSNGRLAGTLEVPTGTGTFPVALIIAGSGPTDREGNNSGGLNTNAYKLLAEGLAKNGIASLRHDKRGIGQSTLKDTREESVIFDDFVNDAKDLLNFLSKDPRFSKRFVIGHSEGSLIGMLAAQRLEGSTASVSGFVSLAGAGRGIDEVILEQLKSQVMPVVLEECKRILNELKAGRKVTNPSENLPAQLAQILFRPSVQPYLISWLKYDPALELKKLKTASLIVQGSTDIQVKLTDANRLADAIQTRPVIIEGMNHVFKTATLEAASQNATYSNPDLPLAPKLLETILEFLKRI